MAAANGLDEVQARQAPRFKWGARTYVMGIINVTPDSFSGDGVAGDPEAAVEQAVRMEAEGADVIDVGGMSTRPGHTEISVEEERERVMGVLPRIVDRVSIPVSIDSYRHDVAAAAVDAGATIINDVWGLRRDPRLADLAARSGAWLVLMHNQDNAIYKDLVPNVISGLTGSITMAEAAGVPLEHLIVDPGIGFGKTPEQNLVVLHRLAEFRVLNLPVLLGTSRKSVIGKTLDLPVDDRVEGTAATVALAIAAGVDMVRVHDVGAMVRVARMADAIVRQPAPAAESG
ncbi:MAG TPA: dihydropteroate synthase [Candidatus Dormibacteraeota bacterium]|nr:dihydropteroate synthase [Candidatus Dormibacteraeota bacterium]